MSACPTDDSVNESVDLDDHETVSQSYIDGNITPKHETVIEKSNPAILCVEFSNSNSVANTNVNESETNFSSALSADTNHQMHSSVNGESSSSSEEGSCHVSPNTNSLPGKSPANVKKSSGRDSGVESTNAEDAIESAAEKSEPTSPSHPPPAPPVISSNLRYPGPLPFSPHPNNLYCPVSFIDGPGTTMPHGSIMMQASAPDLGIIPTTGAPPQASSYQCIQSGGLPPMHPGPPMNSNYAHFVNNPQSLNSTGMQPNGNSIASTPNGSEHFVLVHVNAGETFSVRVGDSFQQIPGPATVRMVSNNGPPMPMSMQVPPGHFVQQIVDEKGILNHVILSPYPTNSTGLGPANVPPNYCNPNGGPLLYPGSPQYPNFYPGSMGNPSPYPSYLPSPGPSNNSLPINTSISSANCSNLTADEKANNDSQLNRNQSKLRQYNRTSNKAVHPSALNKRKKGKFNGNRSRNESAYQGDSSSGEENDLYRDNESQMVEDILSSMPPPKVCEVDSHSALIQLYSPEIPEDWTQEFERAFSYKLLLSDNGNSGKYNCVFCGEATEISLQDLRPATNYYLKASCMYDDVASNLSSPINFRTKACEPNRPNPPTCSGKTRNAISLKWTSSGDNGDKIKNFIVQCARLTNHNQDEFREVFSGPQKISKISKLQPSTQYYFRLAAVNSIGQSEWSDAVIFMTAGSVPETPKVPLLTRRGASYLSLVWSACCGGDEQYILQMEDKCTGHGFMPVYNGPLLQYRVDNLRRNTSYWFRLAVQNEEGQSKWSETVAYLTLPEPPEPPKNIQTRGKVHPLQFTLTWGASNDDGGSQVIGYTLQLENSSSASSSRDLSNNGSPQWITVYQGPDREFQFTQLNPGRTVRVRLRCDAPPSSNIEIDDYQESRFSSPFSVNLPPVVPTRCQPPALLEKPKPNSVHLWWEKPSDMGGSNITNYQIFQAGSSYALTEPPPNPNSNVCDDESRLVYIGRSQDCWVAGLWPGRDYRFSLRASNKAGYGSWSAWLSVRSGPGVPCSPSLLRLVHRSAGSLTIGWNQPQDNGAAVEEFRLECQYKSEGDFVLVYSGECLEYELRNLEPAASYSVRVSAVNSAGCSAPSESLLCTTCATSPAQMQPLAISEVSADSCLLSWQEAKSQGSALIGYNIEITGGAATNQPQNQKSSSCVTVTPDMLSHTIDNLTPNTIYRFRIQAVNHVGAGPFSTSVKTTTRGVPPPPPRLQLHQALSNSLKLHWEEVESNSLLHYLLEMSRQPNHNWQSVYSGPNLSHKVGRLPERTQFYFRISASNEAGSGPYSLPVSFSTTSAVPPPVKSLKITDLKPTSCRITWQPVKAIGSDPIVYIIQIRKSKGNQENQQMIHHTSELHYRLSDLQANTTYQARVCAARSCLSLQEKDTNTTTENSVSPQENQPSLQEQERALLNGAYSPTQEFHTPSLSGSKGGGGAANSSKSLSTTNLTAKEESVSSSPLYGSSPSLSSRDKSDHHHQDDKVSTQSSHQHHKSVWQIMRSSWRSFRTRDLSDKQIAFFVTLIFLVLAGLIAFIIKQISD